MNVIKRNGAKCPFSKDKIKNAVLKALAETRGEPSEELDGFADKVCDMAISTLSTWASTHGLEDVDIETVQDHVEIAFYVTGMHDSGRAYVLYRAAKAQARMKKHPDTLMRDYVFISRYSRYDEKLGRRETWEEAVKRVFNMHRSKFKTAKIENREKFDSLMDRTEKAVLDLRLLPSMRSMQYGGPAIKGNNARMYNCAFELITSVRSFSDALWMLLCGCGVGFSVQKQHVAMLPPIARRENLDQSKVIHHTVEDTIEGWANALKALMACYISGGLIEFNYSKIRPQGTKLKTSGGKAPGHYPLKQCLREVKKILEGAGGRKLKPIECYDILMHAAQAVLSGGCRRSATICLFSYDDEEMMTAKTGDWFKQQPQRSASNNSAVIIRNRCKKEDFDKLFECQKQFGEPGFVFLDDENYGVNPCLPGWARLLTETGIRELKDVNIGDKIWSETGWTTVLNKWSTGVKPVHEYRTTSGSVYCTEDHRLLSGGVKTPAAECDSVDVLTGPYTGADAFIAQDVMDGLVIGDGSVHKASNNLVYLCIGKDDTEYLGDKDCMPLIIRHRPGLCDYAYEIKTTCTPEDLPKTYSRRVPERFLKADSRTIRSFLRGLYSANGSVCGKRVTLKSASKGLIEDVQCMLSAIGIASYHTTNRPSTIKFSNGTYTCRESYDLNIGADRHKFYSAIGFIQGYKMERLLATLNNVVTPTMHTKDIVVSNVVSTEEVFDITVDNEPHTFWCNGFNISNCAEIGINPQFRINNRRELNQLKKAGVTVDCKGQPITVDSVLHGFQVCNLTTINGGKVTSRENFLEVCQLASFLGTLQASYTDFSYLGKVSEMITEREALLGVAICGIMDRKDILLDPDTLRAGAHEVVSTNELAAGMLGINPAARCTAVKPDGSVSLLFGTGSGIHPRWAKRYFRRVQANKLDPMYQHFKKANPEVCEPSAYGANGTDDMITFMVEAPDGAVLRSDLNSLDFLEAVKLVQQNWVIPGTANTTHSPGLRHNVSNTVPVKEGDWDKVRDYIWENREFFTGVSLFPDNGDKVYAQAPMEAVVSKEDVARWNAAVYKSVDYSEVLEQTDQTKLKEIVACAGGQCEL